MLSHLLFKDKLTILFCLLDDFLALLPKPNQALVSGRNPAGRPANLTPSEVLTLALFRFWTTLGNWKAFYEAIPKSRYSRASWFDKLTMNGTNPFVLSLSKGLTRPSLNFGTGSCLD
jgi:hypothetical protein